MCVHSCTSYLHALRPHYMALKIYLTSLHPYLHFVC
jgi:hypothetical protein